MQASYTTFHKRMLKQQVHAAKGLILQDPLLIWIWPWDLSVRCPPTQRKSLSRDERIVELQYKMFHFRDCQCAEKIPACGTIAYNDCRASADHLHPIIVWVRLGWFLCLHPAIRNHTSIGSGKINTFVSCKKIYTCSFTEHDYYLHWSIIYNTHSNNLMVRTRHTQWQ